MLSPWPSPPHLLSGFLQQPPNWSSCVHPGPPSVYSQPTAGLPAQTKADHGTPLLKSFKVTQSKRPKFSQWSTVSFTTCSKKGLEKLLPPGPRAIRLRSEIGIMADSH